MTIKPIEDIILKFEGGDRPKSSDYIDLIDTLAALPSNEAFLLDTTTSIVDLQTNVQELRRLHQ